MTLNELHIGESGTVTAVVTEDAMKRRLAAMGVAPGVSIRLLRTAPSGDPLEYRIMGYNLALRKRDAEKIIIEKDGVKK